MFNKYSTLALFLLGTTATASIFAEMVPQTFDLNSRSARTAGGFVLVAATAPPQVTNCGDGWYCPIDTGELQCTARGSDTGNAVEACCPTAGDTNCLPALQKDPLCADSSWVMWNATLQSGFATGYFCCLPGQIGLQTLLCVEPDTVSSPTGLAIEISISTSATVSIPVATETLANSASASTSVIAGASASASGSSSNATSTLTTTSGATTTSVSSSPSATTLAKSSSGSSASPTTSGSVETNPVATTGAGATASPTAKANAAAVANFGKSSLLSLIAVLGFGVLAV